MATGPTVFPAALDVFPNVSSATLEDEPGFEHDLLHNWVATAIAALQAKVGIDDSTVPTSLEYRLSHLPPTSYPVRADITSDGTKTSFAVGGGVVDQQITVWKNGALLPVADYSVAGGTVTPVTAPVSGDVYSLWCMANIASPPVVWVTAIGLSGAYSKAMLALPYSSDLDIFGGDGNYVSPRITSGSLPPGLALSVAGGNKLRLSGTPAGTAGTAYTFTVAVDSTDGQTATSSSQSVVVHDYDSYVASLSPSHNWKMHEVSGTTATDSVAALHGTYVNTPTLAAPALRRGAPGSVGFGIAAANGSMMTTPPSLSTGGLFATANTGTLIFWYKHSASSTYNWLAAYFTDSSWGDNAYRLTSALGLEVGGSSALPALTAPATIVDGLPHMVVIRKSAAGYAAFVDGVMVTSSSRTTGGSTSGGEGFTIPSSGVGRWSYYPTRGWVSDVVTVPRALTDDEIATLWALGSL